MEIPLFRLPFLVQIVLHKFMELPEIVSLATLSKRCRRLSKVLLRQQSFEVAISYNTKYEISLNEKKLDLDFKTFRAVRSSDTINWKIIKAILVPNRDRHLDARDVVKAYGDRNQMTLKMVKFLFELFTNLTISVKSNDIKSTAKLLNVIKTCKDEHQNEKPLVKLVFHGLLNEKAILPPLSCDHAHFSSYMSVKHLIQTTMTTCKKVEFSYGYFNTADLKHIFTAWESGSSIEYMEMAYYEKEFYGAMEGINKRKIKVDGKIQNCYVIRQTSEKEAVVYHSDANRRRERVFLRTDFEEVVDNN